MNWTSTRAIAAALLMGAAATFTSSLTVTAPANAAAAPTFKIPADNKPLADAVTTAMADAKGGRYADAIAKAKQADGMPGKPQGLTPFLHQMIVGWAVQAKDYNTALDQVEKMIATNEGNKNENIKQALSISFAAGNKAKQKQYADQLGGNLDNETRLLIASEMAKAGQNKEALEYAAPALEGNASEAALKFKQALYFKMNDVNGRRAALEQLVASYPKLEYWHDLLQLTRNTKGMTDEQTMDIYRLRLAVGDLKTEADYQEMAQQALIAGYPVEAKAVVDKGIATKAVQNGERVTRLIAKIESDRVAVEAATKTLETKAPSDPNAGVKLGLIYWSSGKGKEAEEVIRKAMSAKPADPESAKVALGHALQAQGKKPEAVAAFDSVARNSKEAPIARLWSIYAKRA
jgi:hypothetical protein